MKSFENVTATMRTGLTDKSRARHVHLLNTYSLSCADKSGSLRNVLRRDDAVNLADGWPVARELRLRHVATVRVRGVDFMRQVFSSAGPEVRHFLLGSTEEILALLELRLVRDFPHALIVGKYSPPFGATTDQELKTRDETILRCRPTIVWVGLGTPKQDFEAARIADLGYTAVAVGAAFDFLAGSVTEAPFVLRRIGLEWLVRLVREPRRLWRRYAVGYPRFVVACLLERNDPVARRGS